MIKAILTKGLQNSGRSTWSKQFVKENQDYKRICRDDFRHMLFSYEFSKNNEELVKELVYKSIEACIIDGYNIVLDEMNLSEKILNKNKRMIEEIVSNNFPDEKVEFEIKEFPITLSEAIERHKNTNKPFNDSVIKNTYKRYEVECKQMIERSKPKIKYVDEIPDCVIFDIDGTLSNSVDRKIFDDENIHKDKIISAIKFLNAMCAEWQCGVVQFSIILMSGRQDSCKDKTEEWLKNNNIKYDHLYMRTSSDYRKDTIVKKELYEKYIKDKYNVLFVVDDRPCVCQMWIDQGIFVFNVSQDPMAKNVF